MGHGIEDLEKLTRGSMLPVAAVGQAGTPERAELRPTRGRTSIIFLPHSPGCRDCSSYASGLPQLAEELKAWDARLVLVAEETAIQRKARVIVADSFGQVFHVAEAGERHDLPPPRELAEWLKFLGTLCPE